MKFVGSGRREIVAGLTRRYDAVVEGEEPHLVCLLGEAGWGKTRIVQEFYAWLQAERQPEGAYWPLELTPVQGDPMTTRKVVSPERFEVPPGVSMPWLWLGLRCERDEGGRRKQAILGDGAQLNVHLAELIEVAARRSGDQDLAITALGEAIGFLPVIGQVASVVMGAQTLLPKLKDRFQEGLEAGRRRREAEQTSRTIDAYEGRPEEVRAQLELVRQFVSPSLPLTLIVDDAHEADPGTVEFVDLLLGLNLPILVICTAWPSALGHEKASPDGDSHLNSFGGLLEALAESSPRQVSKIELEPLRQDELTEMVRQVAPATAEEAKEALVETSGGNPLVLGLQLTSAKVARSIEDGAITLSPEELHQLPRRFGGLIDDRFELLPEEERRFLAEAALQGEEFLPAAIGQSLAGLDRDRLAAFVRGGEVGPWRFSELPVFRVIREAAEDGFTAAERKRWATDAVRVLVQDEELRTGPAMPVWCRVLVRLAEQYPDLHELDRESTIEAAIDLSFQEREHLHHDQELAAAETAVRWAGSGEVGPSLRARSMIRRAAALRAANEPNVAAGQAREAISLLEAPGASDRSILADGYYVLGAALRQNEDLGGAQKALQRGRRLADDADMRIAVLELLAEVENEAGDADAAREILEEALGIAQSATPPKVETILRIETDITDLDPFFGSAARWRSHLDLIGKRLGSQNPLYTYCLESLCLCLLMRFEEPDVIDELIEQIEGMPEHASVLDLLRAAQRALKHGDAGDMARLLSGLSESPYATHRSRQELQALASVRSPDGPTASEEAPLPYGIVALARKDLDGALTRMLEELRSPASDWAPDAQMFAVQACASLLTDRWIASGEPLPAAGEIVVELERMCDGPPKLPAAATEMLRIYSDAERMLSGSEPPPFGPGLPPVLVARGEILRALACHQMGRSEQSQGFLKGARARVREFDGIDVWRALATVYERCGSSEADSIWEAMSSIPDLDEDERLAARSGYAAYLSRQGNVKLGAKIERETLAWQEGSHGADSEGACLSKVRLARLVGGGDPSQAARLLEEVVQSRLRALDEGDSRTIEAKREWAIYLRGSGDFKRAADPLREAFEWQQDALGPEAELTLSTATDLADTFARLHEFEQAQPLLEHVIVLREVNDGPDDGAVRMAKNMLASMLEAVERPVIAAALRREVLRSRLETLGEDHRLTFEAMISVVDNALAAGRYQAATELAQRARDGLVRTLGEGDELTMTAGKALAVSQWALGRQEDAIATMEGVVAAYTKFLGPENPHAEAAAAELAEMRTSKDEDGAAAPVPR